MGKKKNELRNKRAREARRGLQCVQAPACAHVCTPHAQVPADTGSLPSASFTTPLSSKASVLPLLKSTKSPHIPPPRSIAGAVNLVLMECTFSREEIIDVTESRSPSDIGWLMQGGLVSDALQTSSNVCVLFGAALQRKCSGPRGLIKHKKTADMHL